jgi:hypothetical protein
VRLLKLGESAIGDVGEKLAISHDIPLSSTLGSGHQKFYYVIYVRTASTYYLYYERISRIVYLFISSLLFYIYYIIFLIIFQILFIDFYLLNFIYKNLLCRCMCARDQLQSTAIIHHC